MTNSADSYVFGLDIGTRSIVGTVGYLENDVFHVVAQKVLPHETRAMLDGQIHDIEAVANSIKAVKKNLELQINKTLKKVCIAAAGRVLCTESASAEINYEDDITVTGDNVYELNTKGVEKAFMKFKRGRKSRDKFYCVGHTPVRYYLNGNIISNLVNHKAYKIGIDLIATFLPYDVIEGLYKAVELADLEVVNLTLEPIAAITVAIPEKYRMLNIALVDVGAGTSDICLTSDGSIIAYGMIPTAGDALTEAIAKHCLVEFNVAEQIKIDINEKGVAEYEDILGLPMSITKDEIMKVLNPCIDEMTTAVCDCIKKLNKDKPVSAIFVVGGGGKIDGYTEMLAQKMDIAVQRVALRGQEVLSKVTFNDDSIVRDSLLVTPIGICLNYYEQNNNFIYVSFNEDRIKLYDNGNLSIVDVLMQAGIKNEDLFPKRGKEIKYTIDGAKKSLKGDLGEPCIVKLNGNTVDLHTMIHQNDIIKFVPSTKGGVSQVSLAKVIGKQKPVTIYVDKKKVVLPTGAYVNGETQLESYILKDGDAIEIHDYYTVDEILKFLDYAIQGSEQVFVNNEPAESDTRVYDKFNVEIREKEALKYEDLPEDEEYIAMKEAEKRKKEIAATEAEINAKKLVIAAQESMIMPQATIGKKDTNILSENAGVTAENIPDNTESVNSADSKVHNITIIANGKQLTMTGKAEYNFVDVFDYIDIDLTAPHGSGIVTNLNGVKSEMFVPIKDGDTADIYWKE